MPPITFLFFLDLLLLLLCSPPNVAPLIFLFFSSFDTLLPFSFFLSFAHSPSLATCCLFFSPFFTTCSLLSFLVLYHYSASSFSACPLSFSSPLRLIMLAYTLYFFLSFMGLYSSLLLYYLRLFTHTFSLLFCLLFLSSCFLFYSPSYGSIFLFFSLFILFLFICFLLFYYHLPFLFFTSSCTYPL